MAEYEKISFNCDSTLIAVIRDYVRNTPGMNQTVALNKYIADGLKIQQELERYKNLYENATLKILYILREIARTRGDEFLVEIDKEFNENLPDLKDLIIKEGMDYVG